MKTCKINPKDVSEIFKYLGMGVALAAVVAFLIDNKLDWFQALLVFGVAVWFLIIGVCRE